LSEILQVSIHAPLRGATRLAISLSCLNRVSIHAPLRGATAVQKVRRSISLSFNPRTPAGCDSSPPPSVERSQSFNPRTPAGCDLSLTIPFLSVSNVSIHAPLRGATQSGAPDSSSPWSFNPRTPAGCDPAWRNFRAGIIAVSIHAPLRGATRRFGPLLLCRQPFQSTHPCGVRLGGGVPSWTSFQFQSTHPCGVRLSWTNVRSSNPRFNPRTPAGCDRIA